eukprot:INCI5263.1.p1 GENE.INCI5263.1~~INCI5263.1.p1  ORF type:complete len:827 (+),score=117.24 INCI5263.1:149-2629(+)
MANASYLGYSDYRPITPQHNFSLASHFDQSEGQCYEKQPRAAGRLAFRAATNPATGRHLLENTSFAADAQRAERVDLLLPVRVTSELNFAGYFLDSFTEHDLAVRRCNITFFLEDRTVRVYEPRTQNSGYVQGEFLKRSFVMNPGTGQPYSPHDFCIGATVQICGHNIRITDADALTRQQLDLGAPSPVPKSRGQWPYSSPVSVVAATKLGNKQSMPNYGRHSTLTPLERQRPQRMKMFLDHDGDVLRFFGVWHASTSDIRGDRNVVVLFYLADRTIEIVEGESREEDLTKRILRRQRVVKPGSRRQNCIDHLPNASTQYIDPTDLRCGNNVTIFGKIITLHHTDQFTKEWYDHHVPDIQQVLPEAYHAPAACQPAPAKHFNGYGASVDEQFSRPEDTDGTDDGVVLRFQAKMYRPERTPGRPEHLGAPTTLYDMADGERQFVISFFPNDTSCMVVELPSAVTAGGTFLKRARYRFHETGAGSRRVSVVARRFRATDFVPGAVVSFESEPVSGSRHEQLNIPQGPASAQFVIGVADSYAQEYVAKEGVRRTHRVQGTLDCLRAHFLDRGMSPSWVRSQLHQLGRMRVSKSDLRRALDSLELHPLVFSNGALDFLFEEFGEIDQTYGPMMFHDDLVDALVHPMQRTERRECAIDTADGLFEVLERVPNLRPRLRDCDVGGVGRVTLFDVMILLRQEGILASMQVVQDALRDFLHSSTASQGVLYNELCTACSPCAWVEPLRSSSPPARPLQNEDDTTQCGPLIAPPSSIAAIAGLGQYPKAATHAPENHFYQDPSLKTENPELKAIRSRMLGSAGVSGALSTINQQR